MKKDKPTSFRLTEEAKILLAALAEKYGISQTAMLEILIREKAKDEHMALRTPALGVEG